MGAVPGATATEPRKRGDRENLLYTAQPGHCQVKRPQAVANLRSKRPEIAEPNRGDAATNRDIRQKGHAVTVTDRGHQALQAYTATPMSSMQLEMELRVGAIWPRAST